MLRSYLVCCQSQNVILVLLADDGKAGFLQDPDGRVIVLGYTRVEGAAYLHATDEYSERLCGDTLAPVFPSDLVADLSFAILLEALYVSGHLPVKEDGLLGDALVGQDLGPVRSECVPIPGREICHTIRHRVPLVLKEDGEVFLDHVAQHYVSRPSARCTSVHVATSSALAYSVNICAVARKHLTYNDLTYQPPYSPNVGVGAFSEVGVAPVQNL
jgi:hypothetical protein